MKNNDTVFIDTSKEVKDTLVKLSKSALRASGKIIGKKLKDKTKKYTGNLSNQIGYWARLDRKTGQPFMDVGYYSKDRMRRKGKQPSHSNPAWAEFGVKAHAISIKKARSLSDGQINYGVTVQHPGLPAQNTLKNVVVSNIQEIVGAQEKYLKELNKQISDIKGIDDSEEEEDV